MNFRDGSLFGVKSAKMKRLASSLLFLCFCAPYFYLITRLPHFSYVIAWDDFFWALKNSLIQACGTLLVSLMSGFFLSLYFMQLTDKRREILRLLFYAPIFFPGVFTVAIALQWINPFPFGHLGVIFVQGFMYTGLVAFYLLDLWRQSLGHLGHIAEVYNLSRWHFFKTVLWPTVRRPLILLGAMVLAFSFSSFSIPMLVGGGKGTNIEVFIFERIYIDADYATALFAGLLQIILLSVLSAFSHQGAIAVGGDYVPCRYMRSRIGGILGLAYATFFWGGLFVFGFSAAARLQLNIEFFKELYDGLLVSVGIFLFWTMIFLASLVGFSKLFYSRVEVKSLNALVSPSGVVLGFSLFLFFSSHQGIQSWFVVALGAHLIYFLGIYFTFFHPIVMQFREQRLVAHIYGLSHVQFLLQVLLPYWAKPLCTTLALIFLVSLSDFVIVAVSGQSVVSIGVVLESYLSSYRSDYALFIALLGFAISVAFYFLLRLGYVVYKKLSY
jgi:thiamine transport system permease protein